MSENKIFREWWAKNKKTVLIIGGVAIVIGTGFALFKYRKLIFELFKRGKRLLDAGAVRAAKAVSKASEEKNPSIIDEITPKNKETDNQTNHSNSFKDDVANDKYFCVDANDKEISNENKIINNGEPFKVNGHIRNLGNHRQPSLEKRQEAEAMGIPLGEHETFVDSYEKNTHIMYINEPVYV